MTTHSFPPDATENLDDVEYRVTDRGQTFAVAALAIVGLLGDAVDGEDHQGQREAIEAAVHLNRLMRGREA